MTLCRSGVTICVCAAGAGAPQIPGENGAEDHEAAELREAGSTISSSSCRADEPKTRGGGEEER